MNSNSILTLTDASFQKSISKSTLPVIVNFWADWCGPCHMIAPVIEDLAQELGDRVTMAKLNVDENPEVTRLFGIRSIPTLLFFKHGHVVDHIAGVMSKQQLSARLRLLNSATQGESVSSAPA